MGGNGSGSVDRTSLGSAFEKTLFLRELQVHSRVPRISGTGRRPVVKHVGGSSRRPVCGNNSLNTAATSFCSMCTDIRGRQNTPM